MQLAYIKTSRQDFWWWLVLTLNRELLAKLETLIELRLAILNCVFIHVNDLGVIQVWAEPMISVHKSQSYTKNYFTYSRIPVKKENVIEES